MKTILKYIITIIVVYILIDIFMFMAWVSSNQKPADNFYIGSLTAHIIK